MIWGGTGGGTALLSTANPSRFFVTPLLRMTVLRPGPPLRWRKTGPESKKTV